MSHGIKIPPNRFCSLRLSIQNLSMSATGIKPPSDIHSAIMFRDLKVYISPQPIDRTKRMLLL